MLGYPCPPKLASYYTFTLIISFQDALKVVLPTTVDADVADNVFYKYCECGIDDWLAVVCGKGSKIFLIWGQRFARRLGRLLAPGT